MGSLARWSAPSGLEGNIALSTSPTGLNAAQQSRALWKLARRRAYNAAKREWIFGVQWAA